MASMMPVRADYMLQPEFDRVVLLIDASTALLQDDILSFSINKDDYRFKVDQFWMQDRIWSDGICVGVSDDDPKSAVKRILDVKQVITSKQEKTLLIECVWPKDARQWQVTYLRIFDPATEYPRYFPVQESYDTIRLPEPIHPKTAEEFLEILKSLSIESLRKLKQEPQQGGPGYPPQGVGSPDP